MYNVRDIDWMLKSMSIHQRDNKGIVKFNFLTSCLTFMGSIPTVIRSFEFDKIKVTVDALEETCGDAAFGDKAKSIGESYESSIVCGVTIDVSLFNGHSLTCPCKKVLSLETPMSLIDEKWLMVKALWEHQQADL